MLLGYLRLVELGFGEGTTADLSSHFRFRLGLGRVRRSGQGDGGFDALGRLGVDLFFAVQVGHVTQSHVLSVVLDLRFLDNALEFLGLSTNG